MFSDEQWARIEPLLPSNAGRRGHPFADSRRVVEGIVYRYRTGAIHLGEGPALGLAPGGASVALAVQAGAVDLFL